MWLGAFIWVLAHKEKDADITSKTKSQPKQKGFRGFLFYFPHFNKIDEEPMKAYFLWLSLLIRFGKTQINLVFLSLIRNFEPRSKLLSLGNEKKNRLFFCISLA